MKRIRQPERNEWKNIFVRPEIDAPNLEALVKEVFDGVADQGDKGVETYMELFQNYTGSFLVTQEEIEKAQELVSPKLKTAMQTARQNIQAFHAAQKDEGMCLDTMEGVHCWRKSKPIDKVGLYIPAGTAPLFSTVLMLGIPAKLAGCTNIVMCTPCDAFGKIDPAILFAANLVGIDQIFKIGGVQAIAAMTLGTESVPAVYKLFGPGNQYVTAAKQYAQKYKVAIDMPAGPSEVMVVADESAVPEFVAADLLSQAEHGADSQVVLLTDSEQFADCVEVSIKSQIALLPRKEMASVAMKNSLLVVCDSANFGELINLYAPEHLILATKINERLLDQVVNAGSVFIGNYTPESAGDYASGTNHTLPTNGYAKQYSGVSLDSFVKKITYQEITKQGLMNIGPVIECMAEAEALEGHKNAVSIRLKSLKS